MVTTFFQCNWEESNCCRWAKLYLNQSFIHKLTSSPLDMRYKGLFAIAEENAFSLDTDAHH